MPYILTHESLFLSSFSSFSSLFLFFLTHKHTSSILSRAPYGGPPQKTAFFLPACSLQFPYFLFLLANRWISFHLFLLKVLINLWAGFSVIFLATYTANIAAHFAGLFTGLEVKKLSDSIVSNYISLFHCSSINLLPLLLWSLCFELANVSPNWCG